jgi:hypothetical protein
MTPYLLVKVVWVAGGVLGLLPPGEELSLAGWTVLNAVTILMATAGIVLGLALAQPWGSRIPAPPLLGCAWIGAGFLVPMLPYTLLNSTSHPSADDGGAGMPAWEGVLIAVGFAGTAVCLAVALPAYFRERWPEAFDGTVRPTRGFGVASVAIGCALVVALVDLHWAAGGTPGLRHPELRGPGWRLLSGNSGSWALLGAAGTWSLTSGRPARTPLWIPMTTTWLVSGFLVAWGGWRLPFAGYLATGPAGCSWS